MAQGKSKLKSKVQGKISKKNPTQKAGISKIKKGNKIIAPRKQTQQVGTNKKYQADRPMRCRL
jgi:hypothetical protein